METNEVEPLNRLETREDLEIDTARGFYLIRIRFTYFYVKLFEFVPILFSRVTGAELYECHDIRRTEVIEFELKLTEEKEA